MPLSSFSLTESTSSSPAVWCFWKKQGLPVPAGQRMIDKGRLITSGSR